MTAIIPEVVKVGPYLYTIYTGQGAWDRVKLEREFRDDDNWGYTDQHTSSIYITPKVSSRAMEQVILVHELFHAIVFVAGEFFSKKRTVEFIILHIAPLWLAVLQDNPQLLDYLSEGVEDGEA